MADDRLCSIPGCEKRAFKRSWCSAHYGRWWRHGDPTAGTTANGSPMAFIRHEAVPFRGTECLLWPFSVNDRGYGKLAIDSRFYYAHRFVCELVHGAPTSDRPFVAHACGVRLCCNPGHLRWATASENQQDRFIHGTDDSGEKFYAAKLTAAQVREIRGMRGRELQRQTAQRFGISQGTVSRIQTGRRWAR